MLVMVMSGNMCAEHNILIFNMRLCLFVPRIGGQAGSLCIFHYAHLA